MSLRVEFRGARNKKWDAKSVGQLKDNARVEWLEDSPSEETIYGLTNNWKNKIRREWSSERRLVVRKAFL